MRILAPTAPIVHPQFSVVLRIRFAKSESSNHPFRMTIVNEDGKSILPKPFRRKRERADPTGPDESVVINLVVNFRDIKFRGVRPLFDRSHDGRKSALGSLPLFIKAGPEIELSRHPTACL